MKMSKGWDTLNAAIKHKQAEWDGSQGGPGSIPFSVSYLVDVRDLLKEMAEALSAYANDSFDATSLGDRDDQGQGKLARKVLYKFKEWR